MMMITSDGRKNIYCLISCFVVHFGTSSDDPWLRGCWQSAGSEKCDTEQKTAFHKIGRHPVFHILAVSDIWRLLVMSKSERHYISDLASAELLAIVGNQYEATSFHLTRARQRINMLMCTAISRHVEKGRLSAQLVTEGHCVWYFSVK